MNSLSYSEIIKKLPYDKQIEIVENTSRKKWTQEEIANIQQILKEQLEKEKTPRKKTDLTSDRHLTEVDPKKDIRINSKIGKLFRKSHATVGKRAEIYDEIKKNPQKYENLKNNLNSEKITISSAHKIVTNPKRDAPNGIIAKGYI